MPHGQGSRKLEREFRDTHLQQTTRTLNRVQAGASVRSCRSLGPSLVACTVSQASFRQAILTLTIRLTCALQQGTLMLSNILITVRRLPGSKMFKSDV